MFLPKKLFTKYNQISLKHLILLYSFGCIVLLLIIYETHCLNSKTDKPTLFKSQEEMVFEDYKNKIFGIDISHYQGVVNWAAINKSAEGRTSFNNGVEISFIIMRAAIGEDEEDLEFSTNWLNAKKLNIIRGAYHYYRPDENSIKQADNFISIVNLKKGDLPPVLDIEATPNLQSTKSLKKGLKKWLNKVETHFGIKPIIYTSDSFYKNYLSDTTFKNYIFWIANFNRIKQPQNKNWKMWQFSEKGRIRGINHDVDFNVFKGGIKELKKMTVK